MIRPSLDSLPWLPPERLLQGLKRARDALGATYGQLAPARVRVLELLLGQVDARVVGLLVDLGVAEALGDEPRAVAELASTLEVQADGLERVLRYAATRDLVARRDDGYAASELTRALAGPGSLAPFARFWTAPWHGGVWDELATALRSGEVAAERALGAPFFDWLGEHPEAAADFHGGMEALSALNRPWLGRCFDFTRFRRICDVGGGVGANLRAALEAAPDATGVLFDRPEVVSEAELGAVASRVERVGGSFFEEVPGGCDLYMLQAIVHDWGDEEVRGLLGRIRAASPGARVLVIEMCAPEDDRWHPARALDLQMLASTGTGRERTRADFERLFASADWAVASVTASPMEAWLFELT